MKINKHAKKNSSKKFIERYDKEKQNYDRYRFVNRGQFRFEGK